MLSRTLNVLIRFEPTAEPFLVLGQSALIVCAGGLARGAIVGLVGQISPQVADTRGLPRQDRVFVAELDLDQLAHARARSSDTARPLPRFPFAVRDLSIVVPDTLSAEIIRGTIQAAGRNVPAPLESVAFFDRYQGRGIAEGSVSVSVRLTFQAVDRTLTDAEVQQSVDRVLAALVHEHKAVRR